MATFKDIVIAECKKQAALVDPVLEDAPIFRTMPFNTASHALYNVYEEIKDVQGPVITDIDGSLKSMSVSTGLKQSELKFLAGIATVGVDKAAAMGGADAYFEKRIPVLLAEGMQNAEKDILYNILRKFAIDNGRYQKMGGSSNANYSIICVRYSDGGNVGLMSPTLYNGNTFDVSQILGGQQYVQTFVENGQAVNRLVYGRVVKACIGVQTNMPKHIYSIVNIDPNAATPKVPSARDIDDMVTEAHADGNSSARLYMHPKVLNVLRANKLTALNLSVSDTNFGTNITHWNGVPIIASHNFLNGTEPNVA